MNIEILHLVEGAKKARGLTVVIDVFRAFSLTCYIMNQGAKRIIPVEDIETAYRLKAENPDYLLVGERYNKKPDGFDFGNSPFQVKDYPFIDKSVIHTTSAGTKGIVNAIHADEILTGSFVNAGAIIRYIQHNNPEKVSLVCMGYSASHPVEEDNYCALYIKNRLENKPTDFDQMVRSIRNTSGKRFFIDEMQEHCPSEDFDLCLDLDCFDFILKAEKTHGGLFNLSKVHVQ